MDAQKIPALLPLGGNPDALGGARQIAGTVVNHDPQNMHDCCAATLSALLDFSGIYVGVRTEVVDLAPHLKGSRNWAQINVGQPIEAGDVGVFVAANGGDLHHIYLVLDATDQ